MNQFSAVTKIVITAVVIGIFALTFFPLAIAAAAVGVPLMVYWAWFSKDHAFPKPWQKPF